MNGPGVYHRLSGQDGGDLRVIVVGVGNAGCRMASLVADQVGPGVDVTCIDTDSACLRRVQRARRVLIGETTTHGFGAGRDPEVGRDAALENYGRIGSVVERAKLVIVLTGLGGGTGSGASPVVAAAARAAGAHTVIVAGMPFEFEGTWRERYAREAVDALRSAADAVIPIGLGGVAGATRDDASFAGLISQRESYAASLVSGLLHMAIERSELQQASLEDIRSVLSRGAVAVAGHGRDEHHDLSAAVDEALNSALPAADGARKADRALLLIQAGGQLAMDRVAEAMERVRDRIAPGASLYPGISQNGKTEGEVEVTFFAACNETRRPAVVGPEVAAVMPIKRRDEVVLLLFG